MYILCVMGNPIEHSKSPWIHAQFAAQQQLSIRYTKIKPEIGKFAQAIEEFKKIGGTGCNITLPFKQEAYQLATQLSERAKIAKAVNTIHFTPDDHIFGDNTDGIGLVNDVTKNIGYSLQDKVIVILGAGGAVRGIMHPLLMQQPKKIIIANRTIENAQKLAVDFSKYGAVDACHYHHLAAITADVVIDATDFNFNVNEMIPDSFSFSENSLAYDLKYSEQPTSFMQWAKNNNATLIYDGFGMLVEQAAESFFIWTKCRPLTLPVIIKRFDPDL